MKIVSLPAIVFLTTLLIVIFPRHTNAQYLRDTGIDFSNDELRVIASPYLNVREYPSNVANIIGRISYYTKLDTIESMYYQDVRDLLDDNGFYVDVNDYTSWSKVIINGNKGYINNSYIRLFAKQAKTSVSFQWMHEGEGQGTINYDPALNWYGVYATEKGRRILKKVNISIQYPLITDPDYSPDYVIKTDSDSSSLFLIGSRTPVHQGLLTDTIFSANYYIDSTVVYIYPGEIKTVKLSNGNSIIFKAEIAKKIMIDSIHGWSIGDSINEYVLKVTDTLNSNVRQVINTDIPGASSAIFYNKPENNYFHGFYTFIYWIGDLDGDNKLDFIVNSGANTESCSQWHTSTLFLSSIADEGKMVKALPLSMDMW